MSRAVLTGRMNAGFSIARGLQEGALHDVHSAAVYREQNFAL